MMIDAANAGAGARLDKRDRRRLVSNLGEEGERRRENFFSGIGSGHSRGFTDAGFYPRDLTAPQLWCSPVRGPRPLDVDCFLE